MKSTKNRIANLQPDWLLNDGEIPEPSLGSIWYLTPEGQLRWGEIEADCIDIPMETGCVEICYRLTAQFGEVGPVYVRRPAFESNESFRSLPLGEDPVDSFAVEVPACEVPEVLHG